jgi:DNA modification methylase
VEQLNWLSLILHSRVSSQITKNVYCLDALKLLESLPYHETGMVVIDPPSLFGIGRKYDPNHAYDADNVLTIDEYIDALHPIASQVSRILRPGGACIMLGEAVQVAAWEVVCAWSGLKLIGDMGVLWNKSVLSTDHIYREIKTAKISAKRMATFLSPGDLPSLFTAVRWHVKPGYRFSYNPSSAVSCQSNIIVCHHVPMVDRKSITQRPAELFNYLVSLLSEHGDQVVDPFCGAGSALVAANICNRQWVGSDKDRAMCTVARKRVMNVEIEEANLQPLYLWDRGELVPISG